MKKIYLDVCCFNRPFDDQTQDRIKLESEAIILLLKHVEEEKLFLMGSAVVNYEISKIPNIERKVRVGRLADIANEVIQLNYTVIERAKVIKNMGFNTYDALHIACAEQGNADVFLTTDDKILRLYIRHAQNLNVRIENPIKLIREINNNE